MKLDQPCTRCKRAEVEAPLKRDLDKQPILVKCGFCGKYSRYNVAYHNDGTTGYWLSKWGRGNGDFVLVRRWVRRDQAGFTSLEHRQALDNFRKRTV